MLSPPNPLPAKEIPEKIRVGFYLINTGSAGIFFPHSLIFVNVFPQNKII